MLQCFREKTSTSQKGSSPHAKNCTSKYSKSNNKDSFYNYGKDKDSYQKYLCHKFNHQFTSNRLMSRQLRNYPRCPVCGKTTFFHHQFKAWCKIKQGFNSFEFANNLISMFIFFYNFVRPYSSLNGLTLA